MNYLLLNTFLTVTQTGSFSKAAEAMNCVQSNITARIKRLESQFGQPLFERGKAGAKLTDFGHSMEQQALRLTQAHEQAERELRDAVGRPSRFRLGSMETTAGARLPPLLKKLTAKYPDTGLSLHTGPTGDLTAMVWERELDAALVAAPIDDRRFRSIPAFYEQLVLARPIKGQAEQSLLAFRTACSYRNIANQWLRINGLTDTKVIEMGTLDGMLGCVEAGIGFAIFPKSAIQTYRHFDNVHLEPLEAELGDTTTLLIWRNDTQLSQVHQTLINYFNEINKQK